MSKISRNDPCPCGSGKKYKNCHGGNNVITFDPNVVNQKLNQLHQQLITFAFDNHEEQLVEQISKYSQLQIKDNEELADIYNTGLAIWIIFNIPFLPQDKTIYDAFSDKQLKNIDFNARNSFKKWNHVIPSVYEVVSDEESRENSVIVKEVLTEKTYEVPMNQNDTVSKGMLFVGALIPFMRFHNFFYTFIKLFNRSSGEIRELLEKYTGKAGTLKESFPSFLAEALYTEAEGTDPLYGKVSQLFANHMIEKNMDEDVILKGVSLWNQYYGAEQPTIKKAESFAAALEYYVQKHLLDKAGLTQTEIADEYDVAPGTVSNNYRKLVEVLGDSPQ